jgi:nitroimidazol reductase NimA-like FMN-containing flavoprotein (pyridoxamine 5'-phosphate oxidase superfamily)
MPTVHDERARLHSYAARSVLDQAPDILARGLVAHVAFVVDGQPYVIPMSYHYEAGERPSDPENDPAVPHGRLYVHGSVKSRLMRHLVGGAPVSVGVTLVDGLVYSRTALDHSMNYRSAVCFGRGRRLDDEEEIHAVFERMVQRYFPGRTAGTDYLHPERKYLDMTALVEIELEAWSAKARAGGPNGPLDSDPDALGSAGLVEARSPEA